MSNPRTQQDWQAMAGTLSIRTQAFIDGKYVDAASGKTFDCVSPIDGRVLGQVADGQEEDINRAVAAARRSLAEAQTRQYLAAMRALGCGKQEIHNLFDQMEEQEHADL